MYDVDIDSEAELVQQMHDAGAKVVCYFDAGGYEDWRDDAASFPGNVLGEAMAGWPGERWLDIRQLDALEPIMRARIETCAEKGFDANGTAEKACAGSPDGFTTVFADLALDAPVTRCG